MRVLVTGGNGFIGSHVVDRLQQQHDVMIVDAKPARHAPADGGAPPVPFVQADVVDAKAAAAVRNFAPQAVVHLAAQVSVTASVRHPSHDARSNVLGLLNIFEAARDVGAKTFVFSSSGGAIYGDPARLPADERTPAAPMSPYGLSKWAGEQYLDLLGPASGVRCVSLRLANVYGPRQATGGEGGVIAIFARNMLDGVAPKIFGDGQQTRDFVFVKDVAKAVSCALDSDAQGPFNISSGAQTSLVELKEQLAAITGYVGPVVHAPARAGEVNRSCLDHGKATEQLHWTPDSNLFAGLAETVDYLRRTPAAAAADGAALAPAA